MSELVESRMGAVAWAIRQRSVSHPRSSNRTSRFPASGFPTGFTARHTESKLTARGFGTVVWGIIIYGFAAAVGGGVVL